MADVLQADSYPHGATAEVSGPGGRGSSDGQRYLLTTFLVLVVAFIFFRSILPRIPRLFLRGRLRVRRVGLRGVRGIEWRSEGFSKRTASTLPTDTSTKANAREQVTGNDAANTSLVIKVQQVYLSLHGRRGVEQRDADEVDEGGSTHHHHQQQQQQHDSSVKCKEAMRKSWITIHVQGVGVSVPKRDASKDSIDEKAPENDTSGQRSEDEEREKEEEEEEEERRLQLLMQSPPASPRLAKGGMDVPMPSFAAAAIAKDSATASGGSDASSASNLKATPFRLGLIIYRVVRYTLLPALRTAAVDALRSVVYFATSSLPFLTSIVDVQIHRVEVYTEEADSVVRVANVGANLFMVLKQSENFRSETDLAGQNQGAQRQTRAGLGQRLSEAFLAMPSRIRTGATSIVLDGLPAARASLTLRFQGLQVFDAQQARHISSLGTGGISEEPGAQNPLSASPTHPSDDSDTFHDSADLSITALDLGESKQPSRSKDIPGQSSFSRGVRTTSRATTAHFNSAWQSKTGPRATSTTWADRWADWALEPIDHTKYASDTGWQKGGDGSTVAESARILAMPGTSTVSAALVLGRTVGANECLHFAVQLDEAMVGADALMRVLKTLEERKALINGMRPTAKAQDEGARSQLSKHVKQQKPSSGAHLLRLLGSFSFTMPVLSVKMSAKSSFASLTIDEDMHKSHSHLASSLQLTNEIRGLHLAIKTSDPSEDLHQRWLGTCGIKGYRPTHVNKTLAQRFRWTPYRRHVSYIEHRRAFSIEAEMASLEAYVGVDGEPSTTYSELLSMGDLAIRTRSTWTPFGLLPSRMETDVTAPRYFIGDPNELAAILEVRLGRISGDLKSNHAAALVAFSQFQMAERKARRAKLGLQSKKPDRPQGYLESLPRFSIGAELEDLSYRIDARDMFTPASADRRPSACLVLAVPKINMVAHAAYQDQYVKRSELDRKAAWKALSKDELEWSLQVQKGDRSGSGNGSAGGITHPREPSGEFARWSQAREEDEEQTNCEGRADTTQKSMTMEEALKKMEELQPEASLSKSDEPRSKAPFSMQATPSSQDQRRPPKPKGTWSNASKSSAAKEKADLSKDSLFNTKLNIESSCTFESLDLSWFIDNKGGLRRASAFDDPIALSMAPAHTSVGALRRHLLVLNTFDVTLHSGLPGVQDLVSNAVALDVSKLTSDARCSLEELDFDLWHPDALSATKTFIDYFVEASRKVDSRLFTKSPSEDELLRPSELGSVPDSAQQPAEPVALLDTLRPEVSFYISIGSIVAHIGGVDEQCDANMSRGVGFECKRIVVEYSNTRRGAMRRLISDHLNSNWGARSALELPEDIRSAAIALATREGRAALGKISLYEVGLFPLLDADQASAQHRNEPETNADPLEHQNAQSQRTPALQSPSILAPAVWEFQKTRTAQSKTKQTHPKFRQQDRTNFIFWMPFSSTKFSLRPPGMTSTKVGKHTEELTIANECAKLLSFKVELLHTYCILVAIASLQKLKPTSRAPQTGSQAKEERASEGQKETSQHKQEDGKKVEKQSKFKRLTYFVSFDINEVHVAIALPADVNLFLHLRRVNVSASHQNELVVGFESLLLAVESPEVPSKGMWEEALRMRDWTFRFHKPETQGDRPHVILNGDAAGIRVPFAYTVHPIIDNTVVAVKATKQLLHQFLKGAKDSIITPVAESPKHLPRVTVNIRILTFEGADDPFETRLNIIWRAGGDENQARAEREAAFADKVATMAPRPNNNSSGSVASDTTTTTSLDTAHTATTPVKELSEAEAFRRAKISIDEARARLDAFNASSWIRRNTNAKTEQARREDTRRRRIYGRLPAAARAATDLPIKLAQPSKVAPLFRSSMARICIDVSPHSRPDDEIPDFIYEQGKGVPRDTEYSLLVPLHLCLKMDEWRIDLRDYPMPLLHFPPTAQHQAEHLSALELVADICIAEPLGDYKAIRHVPAIVVPAATGRIDAIEYGISVPKMAMPTKLFGSPVIKIHSAYPSRVVWGQSLQPAIHDVVRVIEGITSPPHDGSPRIGFWDKLPLIFHGRIHFQFPGEGELHLYLKGSRDPYHILGHGAGWVKCWRGDVEIRINFENEENEVVQIISSEYILAIPDLKDYIDRAAAGIASDNQVSHDDNDGKRSLVTEHKRYMKEPNFRKICLKLTNGVRWGSAVHLERTCTDETCKRTPKCKGAPFYRECRFFDRKPHWEVHQRSREYMDTLPENEKGDSFLGWRTHHIHFSISIYSPKTNIRPHSKEEPEQKAKSDSVNNLYFTPLAWEHFWAWMRLFNSALSLPIRQGKLFPGSLAQSPKFGRHLATIKYRFDISPLFISHLYPQHDKSDWAKGTTTLLGIKTRTNVFHMDLHQRQQETVKELPELGESRKVFHKPFYEAEIDLGEIDFRTLAGQFREPEKQLFPHDDDDAGDETQDIFSGECDVNERDQEWIDLNDFVELDWTPPLNRSPRVKLIQALTCPRFNYYRRIESKRERSARTFSRFDSTDRANKGESKQQSLSSDDERGYEEALSRLEHTKFGREPTHTCLVGKAPRAHMIQRELATLRLNFLKEELSKLEDADAEPVSLDFTGVEAYHREQTAASEGIDARIKDLRKKVKLISEYVDMVTKLDKLEQKGGTSDSVGRPSSANVPDFSSPQGASVMDADVEPKIAKMYQAWESFDNRFFAHNPVIFYSNSTRDILLKYYLSSRRRRGIVHHLTAKAVRYIRELSKEEDEEDDTDDEDAEQQSDGEDDANKQKTSTDQNFKERRPRNDRHKSSKRSMRNSTRDHSGSKPGRRESSRENNGTDLLRGLLNDTMQYIMDEPEELKSDRDHDKVVDENVDPTLGIAEAFDIHKSNICVLLKPQIVLRSLVNDRSTVVLTAIRTRLHNYAVKDPEVEEDSVNERVLYRNYVALDGLQAFHPSKHCSFLDRARQRYGFLHVPLETLIDLKYETKDFDRIAPRTDATLHYDKFNKLRLSDPHRPVAADCESQDPAIDHLRHHMDLIRVRCPRYSVLANSEHFASIYNVVTDLLLYRDPAYREHAKRLETMMLSYDMTDHAVLAEVVLALQVRIRHARELHLQYQLHFDHLNEQGRMDFLSLKAELKDMVDELTLIMEGITAADDNNNGSDKEKKSALRVEAQAQDIAWNMMGSEEGELLAKLSIKGASFTWLNKADNSAANTLSIADLNAVNVHPDAVFTEIIGKYNNVDHPMAKEGRLLDAMWSVLAPVGGIAIIDHFELSLHPLRIQLEMKVGRRIEDYIFGSKRERERKEREKKALEEEEAQERAAAEKGVVRHRKRSVFARIFSKSNGSAKFDRAHEKEDDEDHNDSAADGDGGNEKQHKQLMLPQKVQTDASLINQKRGSNGAASVTSSNSASNGGKRSMTLSPADRKMEGLRSSNKGLTPMPSQDQLRNNNSGESDESDSEETGQHVIAARNASEMRQRASQNSTMVYFKLSETILCLSYKGEKQKSITDLYDLVFKAPRLEYRNRTWANADLMAHIKRDIVRSAWSQKSALIKGVIHHRKPRKNPVTTNLRAITSSAMGQLSEVTSDALTRTANQSPVGVSEVVQAAANASASTSSAAVAALAASSPYGSNTEPRRSSAQLTPAQQGPPSFNIEPPTPGEVGTEQPLHNGKGDDSLNDSEGAGAEDEEEEDSDYEEEVEDMRHHREEDLLPFVSSPSPEGHDEGTVFDHQESGSSSNSPYRIGRFLTSTTKRLRPRLGSQDPSLGSEDEEGSAYAAGGGDGVSTSSSPPAEEHNASPRSASQPRSAKIKTLLGASALHDVSSAPTPNSSATPGSRIRSSSSSSNNYRYHQNNNSDSLLPAAANSGSLSGPQATMTGASASSPMEEAAGASEKTSTPSSPSVLELGRRKIFNKLSGSSGGRQHHDEWQHRPSTPLQGVSPARSPAMSRSPSGGGGSGHAESS